MDRTIGQKLHMLREYKELTQAELSRLMNMARSAYANYELDRREPPISFLIEIADFYDISVDYLVRDSFLQFPLPHSADEQTLLRRFRSMNPLGRTDLLEYSLFRIRHQKRAPR